MAATFITLLSCYNKQIYNFLRIVLLWNNHGFVEVNGVATDTRNFYFKSLNCNKAIQLSRTQRNSKLIHCLLVGFHENRWGLNIANRRH